MPTKRVPKTEEIIVIQGNYGSHGWEDVSAYSKAEAKQAREDLRAYRHSGAGVYRLIRRRVDRVTQEPAKRGSRLTAADKRFRATMSRIGKSRSNPAVECSASPKRDRYRAAKVMHKGEWVQNGGCWDAKGVPSYVGKGESGKRRVIAKKAVRQKASRTPKFVKGARARKAR